MVQGSQPTDIEDHTLRVVRALMPLSTLAHAAERGGLDQEIGDNVHLEVLTQIAFEHVFHAPSGGKSQISYPHNPSLKLLPKNIQPTETSGNEQRNISRAQRPGTKVVTGHHLVDGRWWWW